MAKVIYLHHSGFAVEPDPYVLVFDVCALNMYTPPKGKRQSVLLAGMILY